MKVALVFESVFEAYQQSIYNLSLHYLQQEEDASDATQEIFIKVYQNLDQYQPEAASLKTWVYRIAINHCLDVLRKKKTKKRLGFVLSIFAFQDTYTSPQLTDIQHPGIAAEDKEAIHQLLHIINTLPEAQKTAIILAKIESRSQKEVAEIMGITVKAVESLLQRAKTNLSKKIHR